METGSILHRNRSGRPSIDEDTVDAVRVAFHRSPRKSIRVASKNLLFLEIFICKTLINKLYFAKNCMILSALVI